MKICFFFKDKKTLPDRNETLVDGFQDRTLSSEILAENGVADKHVAVKDNSDLEWFNFGKV